MEKLRWGILSTGHIAGVFARGVAASQTGELVAVGSREPAAAGRFAREFGAARAHGSYEALLADPGVEAVYVATPHPLHAEWTVRAARAGKHILCEKPLTVNRASAERVVAETRAAGVLLMEAFMYRCHPQTARVVELIRGGAIGRVGLVQATFSFNRGFDVGHRLWSRRLGGGGILDVGCYPVSFARLVAGAMDGASFADPVRVEGTGHIHPEARIDDYAAATLTFSNGMIAQAACGVGLEQDNSVRIYGAEGWIHVPVPWAPCKDGGSARFSVHRRGSESPDEVVVPAAPLYALEADAFAAALSAGLREVPQMTIADTLGNMAALDAWRRGAGVTYDGE